MRVLPLTKRERRKSARVAPCLEPRCRARRLAHRCRRAPSRRCRALLVDEALRPRVARCAQRLGAAGGIGARAKASRKDFLEADRTRGAQYSRRRGRQKPQEWTIEVEPGVRAGQRVRAIESVGCYLPGGRFSLASTLLMTVIPAQVAGVRQIVVASPQPGSALLAAAARLGVKRVARVGGAQAIAALAYGTRSIPRIDKIFGPGNRFVTAAKKLVSADCAIDMLAGPTEAIVFARRGNPRYMAADLIAQAEHDPDAISIFVTTSMRLGRAVAAEIERQLGELPRTNLARRSLARNGAVLVAADWLRRRALRESLRARTLEPSGWRRRSDARRSIQRAAFFWATGARNRSATTPAARITCCPRAAWRGRAAAFRSRIS